MLCNFSSQLLRPHHLTVRSPRSNPWGDVLQVGNLRRPAQPALLLRVVALLLGGVPDGLQHTLAHARAEAQCDPNGLLAGHDVPGVAQDGQAREIGRNGVIVMRQFRRLDSSQFVGPQGAGRAAMANEVNR